MRSEAPSESAKERPIEKLTFGEVYNLLRSYKKTYSQKTGKKLKDKAWASSDDPDALLIKNLQNLYDCHRNMHLDSDADSSDDDFFDKHQKCNKWLKRPLMHLLLNQESPSAQSFEFLERFFEKEKIAELQKVYNSKKDIITFGNIENLLRSLKKEFSQKMNCAVKERVWEDSDDPTAKLIRKIERLLQWNKKLYKQNLALDFKTQEDSDLFSALRCDEGCASALAHILFENSQSSALSDTFLHDHFSETKIEECRSDARIPRITFGDLHTLLEMLKHDYKDKMNKEYWMQSTNPTAVLLKNFEILYQDNEGEYLVPDKSLLDLDEDEVDLDINVIDEFHQKFSLPAAKKMLRSVFKWGHKAPQVEQFLKDRFGEPLIEHLRQEHEEKQRIKAAEFRKNTICIDKTLEQERP